MAQMSIAINEDFIIDESDIHLDYVSSSGPGGQKVNKTASKAQLRFNVRSRAIPENVRTRLYRLAGKRINDQGELIIEAQRFRTQEQNREDAIRKLVSLLDQASKEPKVRQKTRPTTASRRRRLDAKKRRAETKRLRSRLASFED
jgi:ribosome-associated protein